MDEGDTTTRARDYINREMVSTANWACTLAVINVLVLPLGFVNHIALIASLFIGWRAWRNGATSLGLHRVFDVGGSYVTFARIGIWLGGFSFVVALLFSILLTLRIIFYD